MYSSLNIVFDNGFPDISFLRNLEFHFVGFFYQYFVPNGTNIKS
jgi:hypothetical protein